MSQQVQELIDKIKTEGIQVADQEAKEIKVGAQTDAQKVVENAQKEAQRIIAEAETQAEQIQESTRMALKQSARDTLLALRKEIEGVLQKVITRQVSDSLSPEYLFTILSEVIKKSVETQLADNDILVVLSPKDLDKLTDGFIAKLQNKVKQTIDFQSSDGIAKGFTISFDKGKSCFDFSDESLAEYLSTYLNAQVAELLKD